MTATLTARIESADADQEKALTMEGIEYAYRRGFITGETYSEAVSYWHAGAYLSAVEALRPEGWSVHDMDENPQADPVWCAELHSWEHGYQRGEAATETLARLAAAIETWEAMEQAE